MDIVAFKVRITTLRFQQVFRSSVVTTQYLSRLKELFTRPISACY